MICHAQKVKLSLTLRSGQQRHPNDQWQRVVVLKERAVNLQPLKKLINLNHFKTELVRYKHYNYNKSFVNESLFKNKNI